MSNKLPEPKFLCGYSTKPVELTYREARSICDSRQGIVEKKIDKSVHDMQEAVNLFTNCPSIEGKKGFIVRMEAIGNHLVSLLEERESIPIPNPDDWDSI